MPRFNCNRIDNVIVVTMDTVMVESLLSMLKEFKDSELHPYEYALVKQLEGLIGRFNSHANKSILSKVEGRHE